MRTLTWKGGVEICPDDVGQRLLAEGREVEAMSLRVPIVVDAEDQIAAAVVCESAESLAISALASAGGHVHPGFVLSSCVSLSAEIKAASSSSSASEATGYASPAAAGVRFRSRRRAPKIGPEAALRMPIPHFVRYSPRSAELACLHEGGHVLALAREGVFPEFVELYAEPEFHARTRAPVLPGSERRGVAAGGTAVEIALFSEGRLVDADGRQIAEREFVIEAIDNAATDKRPFFGADRREADRCVAQGRRRGIRSLRKDVVSFRGHGLRGGVRRRTAGEGRVRRKSRRSPTALTCEPDRVRAVSRVSVRSPRVLWQRAHSEFGSTRV